MSDHKVITAIESNDVQALLSLIQNGAVVDDRSVTAAISADSRDCPKVCVCKPQNYMPGGHIISKY